MKKTILLIALAFFTWAAHAQADKKDELEALRIAFITKQLELTPAEAEKFWPVYNNYQGDLRKMMREQREKKGSELEFEEKVLNLRKQYKPEFTRAISEQKFDKMLRVERSWGEMLRKELQRRRENGERPPMMNRQRPGAGNRQ
jgi:hypothetical protein